MGKRTETVHKGNYITSFLSETKNMGIVNHALNKNNLYSKVIASNKNICEYTVANLLDIKCEETRQNLLKNPSVDPRIKLSIITSKKN